MDFFEEAPEHVLKQVQALEYELKQHLQHLHGYYQIKTRFGNLSKADDSACKDCCAAAGDLVDSITWGPRVYSKLKPLACQVQGLARYLQDGPTTKAINALQNTVKLWPACLEAWCCLASCFWETGELFLARICLCNGLDNGSSPHALQLLSMLIRQPGAVLTGDESECAQASIAAAKAAVEAAPSDGYSWYVLGMSYFLSGSPNQSNSAASMPQPARIHAAFTQAQRNGLQDFADLYYNWAAVHSYQQEFWQAIKAYDKAQSLDPNLPCQAQIDSILALVGQLHGLVANQGGIKGKAWSRLYSVLTQDKAKAGQKLRSTSWGTLTMLKLSQLQHGTMRDAALLCRPLMCVALPEAAVVYLICSDTAGQCFVVALMHMAKLAVTSEQLLTVIHPELTQVEVERHGKTCKFPLVRVSSLNKLLVDGLPLLEETGKAVLRSETLAG